MFRTSRISSREDKPPSALRHSMWTARRPRGSGAGRAHVLRVGMPSLTPASEGSWQVGDEIKPGQADKAIDHARCQVGLTELHAGKRSDQVEVEEPDQTPVDGADCSQRQ